MATVDRMRATLHYKSERALSFMSFLQKLQYMFQLCAEQGEPLSNQAKIRELLAKCQSCQFRTNAIATLKFESQKGNLTFQAAINHLQTLVPETQTENTSGRNVSAYTTRQRGGNRQGTAGRSYARGGRGHTRGGRGGRMVDTTYKTPEEWNKLSHAEKDAIRRERSRKGEQGGIKAGLPSGNRRVQELKTRQTKINREISQLTSEDNTSDKREVDQDGSNSRSISTVTWGSTSAAAFGVSPHVEDIDLLMMILHPS